MSEFEYVSVGIALVYSFTVARLLAALPGALAADRRYWVHALWVLVLLLASVTTWWTIWYLRAVEWNALRFTWALSMPALIYLRAGVLLSASPEDVESWRDFFYECRVPFFAVGVVIACNFVALPAVMGITSWFSLRRVLALAAMLVISVAGLASANRVLQGVLPVANLVMIIGSLAAAST